MRSVALPLKLKACTRFVKHFSRNVHAHRLESSFFCFLRWSCDCKIYLTSDETTGLYKVTVKESEVEVLFYTSTFTYAFTYVYGLM